MRDDEFDDENEIEVPDEENLSECVAYTDGARCGAESIALMTVKGCDAQDRVVYSISEPRCGDHLISPGPMSGFTVTPKDGYR